MINYSGLPANEMLQGNWVSMIHPDDIAIANRDFTESIQNPKIKHSQFRLKKGNETYETFSSAWKPIYNQDNEVSYWIGVNYNIQSYIDKYKDLSDISSQQKITIRNLEKKIKSLEKELFSITKMETIGQLAGGVAHDFNNLLLIISMNTELIRWKDKNSVFSSEIDNILSSIKNGSTLASQIMTFSGKNPDLPVVIDLKKLMKTFGILIEKSIPENIKLNIQISDEVSNIFVDQVYLENSLLNIILNAREAVIENDNPKIDFHISNYIHLQNNNCKINLTPGKYVQFLIRDNGYGISTENINKIFNPFFTTREKGVGLGLSMVHGFVHKANGGLYVESKPNEGTSMHLFLPQTTEEYSPDLSYIEFEKNQIEQKTILVIEDNPLVRSSVVNMIMELGYTCFSAFDSYTALLNLKNGLKVDLILSDVMMPGPLNPIQFSEELQKLNFDIPILYTSGYAENLLVKNGKVKEGHDLIMKPYTLNDLLLKLKKILS